MKKFLQSLCVATSITLTASFLTPAVSFSQESCSPVGRAKNIIFMVPDGMGLSNVTAARIFRGGPDGDNLYFENLPQIGYQGTHARNSTVMDSASAAAAWACGEKFNNNEISCHEKDGDKVCRAVISR